MKKMLAILMTLCLVFSAAACFAAETKEPFMIQAGIYFGMSQAELTSVLGNTVHEIETEHTKGPVNFVDVEVENDTVNGLKADVHYYLANDKLVAVKVDFDDQAAGAFEESKKLFTEKLESEGAALDVPALASGIYVIDDDGKIEAGSELISWMSGSVLVVLEKEKDSDVNAYVIDLSADYITK